MPRSLVSGSTVTQNNKSAAATHNIHIQLSCHLDNGHTLTHTSAPNEQSQFISINYRQRHPILFKSSKLEKRIKREKLSRQPHIPN